MTAVAIATVLLVLASGCGTRQSREAVEAAAVGTPQAAGTGANGVASGTGGTANSGGTGSGATGVTTAAGGTAGDPGTAAPSDGATAAPADAGTAEGGAAPTEGGTAGPANGTPIVIGNVSTTSGISGVAQAPAIRALQAWVAMVNDAGGLNGHPIRLVLADDGADPARHAAAVQDLVENQGVIAFVSNWASQTIQAAVPYLEANRIPVIGGDSSNSTWFQSPMLFPIGPTPDNYMRARLSALAQLTEARSIATIVCRESSVCTEQAAGVSRNAADFGFDVVYEGQASLAQPDFTAECISARNAGAEIIMPTFEAASMRRIAQSCDRQGYRPLYDLVPAIEEDFTEVASFENAVMAHYTFPGTADHPAAQEFRDALQTYQPDQAPIPVAASGWAAGVLFGQVAAAAFPPDATPATEPLLDALWSTQNNNVNGLLGPLTYVRDQPHEATAPKCIFTVQIRGGEFVAPNGMEPSCV
jgi:branched-chain amino acid transport system substrate-binding protein